MNNSSSLPRRLMRSLPHMVLLLAAILLPGHVQAAGSGVRVTESNGYVNISVNDMRLRSTAGEVRWQREWDGQEWKFNPKWESLSQSRKNLTGSQSADTMAGWSSKQWCPVQDGKLNRGRGSKTLSTLLFLFSVPEPLRSIFSLRYRRLGMSREGSDKKLSYAERLTPSAC